MVQATSRPAPNLPLSGFTVEWNDLNSITKTHHLVAASTDQELSQEPWSVPLATVSKETSLFGLPVGRTSKTIDYSNSFLPELRTAATQTGAAIEDALAGVQPDAVLIRGVAQGNGTGIPYSAPKNGYRIVLSYGVEKEQKSTPFFGHVGRAVKKVAWIGNMETAPDSVKNAIRSAQQFAGDMRNHRWSLPVIPLT